VSTDTDIVPSYHRGVSLTGVPRVSRAPEPARGPVASRRPAVHHTAARLAEHPFWLPERPTRYTESFHA
jgi:hypothetical protein